MENMKNIKVKETKAIDNIKPMNAATKNRHEFNKLMAGVKAYWRNVEHFIEAVCLLLVAGFTLYACAKVGMSKRDVLVFKYASLVIGLKGSWELIKSFNK